MDIENFIILFCKYSNKASQFHFLEYINRNQTFILDTHWTFICSADTQSTLRYINLINISIRGYANILLSSIVARERLFLFYLICCLDKDKNVDIDCQSGFGTGSTRDSPLLGRRVSQVGRIRIFNFLRTTVNSTLLHLPPLRIHYADGCWDQTPYRCNWCICSQTL